MATNPISSRNERAGGCVQHPAIHRGLFVCLLIVVPGLIGSSLGAAAWAHAPAPAFQDDEQSLVRVAVGLREQGLRERAVTTCDDFLKRYPRSVRVPLVRYTRAQCLFELARYAEAAEAFGELVHLHPDYSYASESRFRRGESLYRLEKFPEAYQAFADFQRAHVDHYLKEACTFLQAEAGFRAEKYREAELLYREYVTKFPRGEYAAEARRGLAWSIFRQERWKEAAASIRKLLPRAREAAELGELRFLLGEALFQAGEYEDAAKALAKVPEGHEYADDALSARSYAHSKLGRQADAAAGFIRLLQRWPQSPLAADARLRGGLLLLELGRREQATGILEPLLEGKDERAQEANLSLAEFSLEAKRATAAELHFKRALQGPDPALRERARVGLADTLTAAGREDEAASLYEDAASGGTDADYSMASLVVLRFNRGDYAGAIDLGRRFKTKFSTSPHLPNVAYTLAEAYFAGERYGEAEREYRFLASKDPKQAVFAKYRIAWCLYRQGRAEEALAALTEFVGDHGDDARVPEACVVLARLHMERGESGQAAKYYRQALGGNSGEYADDASLGLAQALLRKGELTAAEREYKRFEASYPRSPLRPRALYDLAELLYTNSDLEAASERYRRILADYPEDPLAPYALHGEGWCRLKLGDHAASEKRARDLLARRLPGLNRAGLELLGAALREGGKTSEAAEVYQRIASATGGGEEAAAAELTAAILLREGGNTRAAAEELRKILTRYPSMKQRAGALHEYALAQLELNEVETATTAFSELVREHPRSPQANEARFRLGEMAYEKAKLADALRWYGEVIDSGQKDAYRLPALYKRGWTHLKRLEFAEAAADFDRVVAEEPEGEYSGEALFLAGEGLFRLRDFDGARQRLERVLREFPGHEIESRTLFRLGLACGERGDWASCREHLQRLLDLEPQFKLAPEARLWIGRSLRNLSLASRAVDFLQRAQDGAQGRILAGMKLELGMALADLERYDDAIGQYLQVKFVYDFPQELAQATYLAGAAFLRKGETDNAKKFFGEVVTKFPKDPYADKARQALRSIEES